MNRPSMAAMMGQVEPPKPAPKTPPIPASDPVPKPLAVVDNQPTRRPDAPHLQLPPSALREQAGPVEDLPEPPTVPRIPTRVDGPTGASGGVGTVGTESPASVAARILTELTQYTIAKNTHPGGYLHDQLVQRGLVADVGNWSVITPKGLGVLVDLGML